MRLAMVTSVFPGELDQPGRGVGVGAVVLLRALARLCPDLEIHVVHHRAPRDEVRVLGPPRVVLHRLRGGRLSRASPHPGPVRAEVARVLDAIAPDVIHVRGSAALVDGARRPAVLSVHGLPERELRFAGARLGAARAALHALREPPARRRYRHVIAIAGYVARALEGQIAGRVHFVPNPVDPRFLERPADPAANPPLVVQAGDIGPIKNAAATVRALAILRRRGVEARLRLLGLRAQPAYAARLDRLVAELGLADRVEAPGRVSRADMVEELRRARVLALPSFVEVAPLAIIEAAASGLPVVASPAGGSAELFVDGHSGRPVLGGREPGMKEH